MLVLWHNVSISQKQVSNWLRASQISMKNGGWLFWCGADDITWHYWKLIRSFDLKEIIIKKKNALLQELNVLVAIMLTDKYLYLGTTFNNF